MFQNYVADHVQTCDFSLGSGSSYPVINTVVPDVSHLFNDLIDSDGVGCCIALSRPITTPIVVSYEISFVGTVPATPIVFARTLGGSVAPTLISSGTESLPLVCSTSVANLSPEGGFLVLRGRFLVEPIDITSSQAQYVAVGFSGGMYTGHASGTLRAHLSDPQFFQPLK